MGDQHTICQILWTGWTGCGSLRPVSRPRRITGLGVTETSDQRLWDVIFTPKSMISLAFALHGNQVGSLISRLPEVQRDLGPREAPLPDHDLMPWVKQGVLLLNAVLSVSKGVAGSHHNRGWEIFTDAVIAHLGARAEPTVFMFWGKAAQRKASFVQRDHHLILTAPHPSPLSVYRGFAGCGHFSQCNRFLMDQAQRPIDW